MDWTAHTLSIELAAWTMAILLPVGIALGRLLAWRQFAWKPLAEGILALPLVLPPTVLGAYLLVGLGAASPLGQWLRAAGRGTEADPLRPPGFRRDRAGCGRGALHPPALYQKEDADGRSLEGVAELMVAKHRNGPTGSLDLHFEKSITRFDNLSDREGPG